MHTLTDMRLVALVALSACGGVVSVDAGVDAGVDGGVDAGVSPRTVVMAFMCRTQRGACYEYLDEVHRPTIDDGGLERWRNIYVDGGCAVGDAPDGSVQIDCRALCGGDGGPEFALYECCRPGGFPKWVDRSTCEWQAP